MTPREIFTHNKAKFAGLYAKVKAIHAEILASGNGTNGHGLDHDLMVAQYGAMIAEDPRVEEMAWVAGLLHSFDRHYSSEEEKRLLGECLNLVAFEFSEGELDEIETAVQLHSKRNDPADSPVTVALKDADRLANVGALNIIRGGQHRPSIPACIPETLGGLNPNSTFKEPASCYDATYYNLEWWEMLRLPKARELGRADFEYTLAWQRSVEAKFAQVGLHPWPK